MSRKEDLIDRIIQHYGNHKKEFLLFLCDSLRETTGAILDLIGKPEDTEKLIQEFAAEMLPLSLEISRESHFETYTEEELATIVDVYDKNPWWVPKTTTLGMINSAKINEKGSEIAKRILLKYSPDLD